MNDTAHGLSAALKGTPPRREAVPGPVFAVVVLIGILLRVIQYASQRSLYVDEAALALNLRARPLNAVLGEPFDFAQTAPIGFLFQQNLMMSLLGEHDLVLRLIPFLSGILAVPVFVTLARRLLPSSTAFVVSLLFVFSFQTVYFTADSKPYMIDVAVTAAALLAGLRLLQGNVSARATVLYGVAGAVVVWFSQSAILTLAALSMVLLWHSWRVRRSDGPALLALSSVWALSGAGASLLSLRTLTPSAREYMQDFWRFGFMPVPPRSLEEVAWLPARLLDIGADPLGSLVPALAALLIVLGAVGLRRIGRWEARLVAMPVLLTLFASALKQYPFGNSFGLFSGRVVLFLVPSFLVIIGAGIELSRTFLRGRSLPALMVVLVMGSVAPFAVIFPIPRGEIRPVLEFVAENRRPADHIYVYYGARHVYEWYAPALGLGTAPRTNGVCARWEPANYLSDLDSLPPGRVWIVMTHIGRNEPALILGYMQANASEIARIDAPGAVAVLFHLEEGSLPGPSPVDPEIAEMPPEYQPLGCRGFYEWPDQL